MKQRQQQPADLLKRRQRAVGVCLGLRQVSSAWRTQRQLKQAQDDRVIVPQLASGNLADRRPADEVLRLILGTRQPAQNRRTQRCVAEQKQEAVRQMSLDERSLERLVQVDPRRRHKRIMSGRAIQTNSSWSDRALRRAS